MSRRDHVDAFERNRREEEAVRRAHARKLTQLQQEQDAIIDDAKRDGVTLLQLTTASVRARGELPTAKLKNREYERIRTARRRRRQKKARSRGSE